MPQLDPRTILNNLQNNPSAMANPQVKRILEMRQNNDTEGMEKFIGNMAGEYGTDLNTVKLQFGRMFGIK